MGGGFGNKNQAQDYDYMAAALARVSGQPVKLEFTREDDYIGMHGRWSSEQRYKIGVKQDGTITAVQLDAVTNMGAYRKQSGNLSGTDFYQIPNFKKVILPVHTNTVVAANYRAPAYPQSVFGFASFLDQIAFELGIPLNQLQVTNGDTDVTPYSVGESGSRTTSFTGPAVIAAAEDVRKQIFALAANDFKAKPEELDLRDGQVFAKSDPSKKLPLGRIVKDSGDLIGRATTNPSFPKEVEGKSFVAHFAEVEVDTWTGHVKITRYVAAHDSGTILNRLTAESQVKGGIVQGIGMALTEELLIDKVTGIPINPNYRDAKVPTHLETPAVEAIFIENYDPYGCFGGKVVGEPPITAAVATVANAIFNATGKRFKELPITPGKILQAVQV